MNGLLFASFGTTHENARAAAIDEVAAFLDASLPDTLVAQAFTSGMVRRILADRGSHVPSVAEALDDLAGEGVTDVVVQPGHVLPGAEYDKLRAAAVSCRDRFATMRIGDPLVAGSDDLRALAAVLDEAFPANDSRSVVFMGHGTDRFANIAYAALEYELVARGRRDVHIGTVEAYPSLEDVVRMLAADGRARVLLAPLMQVAGDHATNDMAGTDHGSWASTLSRAGYDVECAVIGLGELAAVRHLYLDHALRAEPVG